MNIELFYLLNLAINISAEQLCRTQIEANSVSANNFWRLKKYEYRIVLSFKLGHYWLWKS